MSLKTLFTEHPGSVGETYTEHMGAAFSFGSRMVWTGCCCLVHGFLPFLFKTKGRDLIDQLHHEMVTHRADWQKELKAAKEAATPQA